jgi:putative phosphoribosyl transferase
MSTLTAIVEDVLVPAAGASLPGLLCVPDGAGALVVFAHGTGSGRLSPRNRFVAESLHGAGLATLLLDLLTPSESEDRGNAFDITLLADRLLEASRWCRAHPPTRRLPIGLFGASTGAAAALVAAAREARMHAVVSRGGRPDLARFWLDRVGAPTLLLVGSHDFDVLELNRQAYAQLRCVKQLTLVEGATHLFEEPGALEQVCNHARDWFSTHLLRPGLR